MKKIVYLCCIACLFLASCAKETVYLDVDTSADDTFKLGGTTWNLIAATSYFYIEQQKFDFDVFAAMPACGKDDTMTFNSNNTITGSYGKLACENQDNSFTDFGTWKLSADKKTLDISSKAFNPVGINMLKCEVIALNENNLQIKYQTTANGITTHTTSSYKRVK